MQSTHHHRLSTGLAVLLAAQLILLPCLWWPVHTYLYHQQDTAVSRLTAHTSQHPQWLTEQQTCSWCDLYVHQSCVPFDQAAYVVVLPDLAILFASETRDYPESQPIVATPRGPPALT